MPTISKLLDYLFVAINLKYYLRLEVDICCAKNDFMKVLSD